jgi:hypothetical protein
MTKKISRTKVWERDHPNDEPCPTRHSAAQVWRRERGLETRPDQEYRDMIKAKYEAAMAEKRQREAAMRKKQQSTQGNAE